MYGQRLDTLPGRPSSLAPAGSALTGLRVQLEQLQEFLNVNPLQERRVLRAQIRDAQRAMFMAGADGGVIALVLRNMLCDLARGPGHFDSRYFSRQLSVLLNSLP